MNFLAWLGRKLDTGWFARGLLIFQFWFCYYIVDWSMAYASTALAAVPARDLLGAAANIAAVAAVPQALLMMATGKYMELRASEPKIIPDRRKESLIK